ncbi:EAL domain-containing protein [Sporosarcina sp. 179-K 3D1 HS]|uniref:putative bifunctional diguanylate cyclase/phosphodiesterase n=1 Tax=Sporosarcina sp. 179-K 3D1 HS TaxID=3232169 RepID=UPI0039A152F5
MREETNKTIQDVIRFDGTLSDQKVFEDITYALDQSAIVAITDRTGKILYVNEQFTRISQYSIEELIGSSHSIVNSGYHPARFFKDMWATIGKGKTWRGEIRNKRKDGTYYWVDTTIVPFLNEMGKPYQYISIRNDITQRIESEKMIRNLAYNDQLTELPNRISFRKEVHHAVEMAEKKKKELAYVRLNIDRLRYINDSLGFEAGDYVLSVIGRRLRTFFQHKQILGRLSGDEFAFLLSGLQGREEVERVICEVQTYLEEPIEVMGQSYVPSFSFGIVLYPEHATKASELAMKAEKALSIKKEHGGGGYEFYQHGTATKSLERILLENELRKSVKLGQFHIDYQPKIHLQTNELIGVEALVRWNHPDLGRIPPDKFIPVAEETKIILPLGEWVLREGCKQANDWLQKGFSPFRLAINMSPVQVEDPGTVAVIQKILEETGTPAELIEIEVTESTFADREGLRGQIQAIRDLGITVSIDDFGTGYSTFSYIKELPADTLKIDMSFIRDIHENEESRAIVKAIIALADTVGLRVIAEGVEYEEQAEILRSFGCLEAQGYLFSKPIPPEVCEQFMRRVGDV